jgi:large subunit ribosomal protein L15
MKRGFTNRFKTYYSLVKVSDLEGFESGANVTPEVLVERGYLRNLKLPVKILGDGELSKSLTVTAHKFTQSARGKIEGAGGRVEEL